jgi:murein DD-endopeptidase MepM/ murein hydrolase activator NlpD
LDSLFTSSTTKEASAVPASQQPYPAAPLAAAPASPVQRGNLPPPATPVRSAAIEAPRPVTAAAPTLAKSAVPLPGQPPAQRVAMVQPAKPKQPTPKPANPEAAVAKKPAKPAEQSGYTVASGDSWNKIAAKTGVAVADLKAANGGGAPLQVGQALHLPKAAEKPVAQAMPAPTLDPVQTAATPKAENVAYTPQQPAKQAIAAAEESDKAEAPDASGVGKMRWPVRGRVVARYGAKGAQASDGIDIAVPEGTPVKAAENGVVIYAGDGLKEFGNTVLVRHEDGLVTVYGHASQIKVTRGEKVTRGQDIALSGMSGTTDTPKLHFEVRKNSTPVDPATFLQ